jgi:hypothetical protein
MTGKNRSFTNKNTVSILPGVFFEKKQNFLKDSSFSPVVVGVMHEE